MDIVKLREYEALSPFEIKDFLAKAATIDCRRIGDRVSQRRPRQSQLDRDRAARGILSARPVRDHRKQARARSSARCRRHAPGARYRRPADCLAEGARRSFRVPSSSARWCHGPSRSSGSMPIDSCTSSSIRSSATTIRCRTGCSCTTSRSFTNTCSGRCADRRGPKGRFQLYAVEGGTAAMCYIFKSMKTNRLLNAGDTIALATPIFTPYLEMPHLEDYDLKIVSVQTRQENRFQFDDAELKKLLDPDDQGVLCRQSRQPERRCVERADDREDRRDPEEATRPDRCSRTTSTARSCPGSDRSSAHIPHNTIGVYSYSKYFGCTGWRLGVIAVHEDNLFDRLIAKHPEPRAEEARQALRGADARATQAAFHRPHRRRQPRRCAQSHRGSVAAPAGHDERCSRSTS